MAVIGSEVVEIVTLTLAVSGSALLISTAVGVPLGAWLGVARFRGRRIIDALVFTGMGLPPVVVGLAVYLLLSRSGPLGGLGLLFTPQAMVIAQVVITLPLVTGLTASSVAGVPRELVHQVRSLGASPWQVRLAVVREARSGVLAAVAAAFGRSISEVGAVMIVGGNIGGHTRVMTTAIVLETSRGDFATALALGGLLLTLAFLVNLTILRLRGGLPT